MWQTASLSRHKFVSFSDVSQNAQSSIFRLLKNPKNIYSVVANMNSYSWQKFVSLQYANFLERSKTAISQSMSGWFWLRYRIIRFGFRLLFFLLCCFVFYFCFRLFDRRNTSLYWLVSYICSSASQLCLHLFPVCLHSRCVDTRPPKVSSYSYWEALIVLEHLIARKNGALEKRYIY